MQYKEWRAAFDHAVALPDAKINLAQAALLIAADEYPELDISFWLARLDNMADELRSRFPAQRDAQTVIPILNTYLFDELDFHGNLAEYYDPRNSYLNDVLERRTGLPITLSVIVLALAQRLRLPIYGVGLPGHFMVKWRDAENEIVFDPFNGGEILDRRGIEARVRASSNPILPFQSDWLEAVSTKYILFRMLQNLKQIFVRAEELQRAWQVVDKILLLDPRAGDEIRDFGLLSLRLGAYQQSAISLEQYLLSHPDAPDGDLMRVYLRRALEEVERLN